MNNTEKRLRNAGLGTEIDNGNIQVESTRNVTVAVMDDYDATDALVVKVIQMLETKVTKWGGFRTRGGYWHLYKNYDPKPLAQALADQTGDWSNYSKKP